MKRSAHHEPGATPRQGVSPEADRTIRRVGGRIRNRRKEIGMTLHELSERTGVSVSMLSMLERGVAAASIGTLVAVASALRVQMHDLFGHAEGEPVSPLTKREDQTEVETVEGVLRRIARHEQADGLEMAVNEYAPGTASGDMPVHHEGHEFGVLVAGALTIELDGVSYQLRPGDSISYESSTPHRISNPGKSKARAVWVNVRGPSTLE